MKLPWSASSSSLSICHVRQTPTKCITKYQHDEVGIAIEAYVGIGVDNQQHLGSDFSTINRSSLNDLVKYKNRDELDRLGGVAGIGTSLKSDLQCGIRGDVKEISCRNKAFGTNSYRRVPKKDFIHFVWKGFKDIPIIILLVCTALSLGFGMREHGPKEGWYDSGSILVAVFLLISVTAIPDFMQNRELNKIFEVNNGITVEVVRNRRRQQIPIFEIVVGDVICLKIGDQVPADGLFIEGNSLEMDECSMTGESDHVEVDHNQNPFLISGTKVVDGYAKMLVTSVGMNTNWGEMMSTINRNSNEQTPLQERLKKLTSLIGMVGLAIAFLVLVVLLVRYFTGNTEYENGNKEFNGSKTKVDDVINAVVRIITAAVTIVVVAIPEGLPLAVTLTLAYSMKRMMSDQAMVRKLSASERMGSATTIYVDISGLSSNQKEVANFFIGKDSLEGLSYTSIAPNVLQLLFQGISLIRDSVHKLLAVHGNDDAIHLWAVRKLDMEIEIRHDFSILYVEASSPENSRIGILVEKKSDKMIHVFWRGHAERILSSSSDYYDTKTGNSKAVDDEEREKFHQLIKNMADSGLHCIAFAHKQLSKDEYENERGSQKIPDKGLILLGLVGITAPCRPGTKEAVEICQLAGVEVKMITAENILTAKAIARECGILKSDNELAVEGMTFRSYTPKEQLEKVGSIYVMARSSPSDKLLMLQCLRQNGHVVAVTGYGTNDAPALREADIGLSMGISGTEMAKESSDIVILDDNFASIVQVLKWGRCVYNNIQKFIQFQLTVNVAAIVINFVAAVSTGKIPLTIAQLLWVNLIMDTLGALALSTDPPSKELMNIPPRSLADRLITNNMWRNIVGQASYQIAVILALMFKGKSIFAANENEVDTLIFTTFVILQVFNQFNARKIEEKNVFEGILKNKIFLVITGTTIILQVVMVEFLSKFTHTERLDLKQWGVCFGIAFLSWPIGLLVKFIPIPKRPMLDFPNKTASSCPRISELECNNC